MKKKAAAILAALALSVGASSAYAEQPAMSEYRKMFDSGNFYVEYQTTEYYKYYPMKGGGLFSPPKESDELTDGVNVRDPMIFAGENKSRVRRPLGTGKSSMVSGYTYAQNPLSQAKGKSASMGARQVLTNYAGIKPRTSYKNPDVLYKDGNYYRFVEDGKARRLSEDQLESEYLNPGEQWQWIRDDLAIPDVLAVLWWDDPFRTKTVGISAPRYSGPSERQMEKIDTVTIKKNGGKEEKAAATDAGSWCYG